MHRFDVYRSSDIPGHVEAVKQGFSWPAFCFGWVWALVKGMPGHGAALLAISSGFLVAEYTLPDDGLAAELAGGLWLAYSVVLGAFGNDWRRARLRTRDFEYVRTVEAQSPDRARALPEGAAPGDPA